MIYAKCPHCGKVLADKEIPYLERLKELQHMNLSKEKHQELLQKMLVEEFGFTRYCCIGFMGYVDTIEFIQ